MSNKVRCGHSIGIDLTQIWFWQCIPSLNEDGSFKDETAYLKLCTSSDTIIIEKTFPPEGGYQNNNVKLEEKDFAKLLKCLEREFSSNLSEDSTLEDAYGK